jgi:hypothetical protein
MEKKHISRHNEEKVPRKMLVMIFIRYGYAPLPIICSGSSFPGMPPLKTYHHETGKKQPYVDLNQFEYIDCLKTAIPQLTAQDPKRVGLRGADELVILHDQERAHLARSVTKFAEQYEPRRLKLVTLPAHSPDLTPHDSGFIANVKKPWHTAVDGSDMPWRDQCLLALDLIRREKPEKYIEAMPLRWKACELEQGGHIEQRLKKGISKQGQHDGGRVAGNKP